MSNESPNCESCKQSCSVRLAHHALRISKPLPSLHFYENALGMRLLATRETQLAGGPQTHYFLGFTDHRDADPQAEQGLLQLPSTLLELIHQPHHPLALATQLNEINSARYWKIGVTLADVDNARSQLLAAGIQTSAATQFLDVGYLCHLNDPDGYCIELLQHDFAEHHQAMSIDPGYTLASAPALGQITLRISNPAASLRFYRDLLGMRLLSRQIISKHNFTLYFLACTDETPPNPDIDAIENREWLWQRPYTMLELQHIWRRDRQGLVNRTDADAGFRHISFITGDLRHVTSKLNQEFEVTRPAAKDGMLAAMSATLLDPDGNAVRFIEVEQDYID